MCWPHGWVIFRTDDWQSIFKKLAETHVGCIKRNLHLGTLLWGFRITTKRRIWKQPEQKDFLQRSDQQTDRRLLCDNKIPRLWNDLWKLLMGNTCHLEFITQWKYPSRIRQSEDIFQKNKKPGIHHLADCFYIKGKEILFLREKENNPT